MISLGNNQSNALRGTLLEVLSEIRVIEMFINITDNNPVRLISACFPKLVEQILCGSYKRVVLNIKTFEIHLGMGLQQREGLIGGTIVEDEILICDVIIVAKKNGSIFSSFQHMQ